MKMNQRKAYSDEFKTEAVRRVQEGKNAAQVAREMGCDRQNVQSWLKRASQLTGKDPRKNPLKSDERSELEQLRRENERLKLEAEILKKAAAFFARELK
jgi:transposase